MSGDERCNECGKTDPMFCGKRFCPLVEAMRHPGPPPAASHHSAAHVAGSDPAPSPSIPDPSDERWRGQIRDLTVDDLIRTASNIGETEACRPLFDWNQEGSWGHPPVDAVLAFMHTAWTAQRVARTLAAARPTSLPEAPEPVRCPECGVPLVGGDGAPECPSCNVAWDVVAAGCYLLLDGTDPYALDATPSAPPVAVDPEAAGRSAEFSTLTISLAPEVRSRLAVAASDEGITLTELLRRAAGFYLQALHQEQANGVRLPSLRPRLPEPEAAQEASAQPASPPEAPGPDLRAVDPEAGEGAS